MESQDTMPEAALEVEETMNRKDWRILKDNQLWEKQDDDKERSQDIDNGEKVQADGTTEKGLGPSDTLVQTGNPYEFRPYTMKLLETDKNKADWQDKDPIITLVKSWVKEG